MWLIKSMFMYFFITYGILIESTKTNVRLYKFTNGCPELNPVINFTDIMINKNKLQFKAYIREDINTEEKVEFAIVRCLTRDSPSTCEKFRTLKVPYYCKVLSMGAWQHFKTGTTPMWQCPFKKGFIVTKKGLDFDLKDMSSMAITGNYYWKVHTKTYVQDTNKTIMCLNLEIETYVA